MASGTALLRLSEYEYHADPCDSPSLSSSIAHTLVSKSPAHAWIEHPRLGGRSKPPTDAMDRGTMVHAMLLGTAAEIEIIDAPDYRTKDARERRDAARLAGKIPILVEQYSELEIVVSELRKRIEAKGIELRGESEVTVLWTEEARDGSVVQCRSRMDHVILDAGVIYDLKTARCANPNKLGHHMSECGYDIQIEAYSRALSKLRPEHEGRVEFVDVFVELEPPYAVTRAIAAGTMRELGARRWERAVNLWSRCMRENRWPDYEDAPVYIDARPWDLEEALASGM